MSAANAYRNLRPFLSLSRSCQRTCRPRMTPSIALSRSVSSSSARRAVLSGSPSTSSPSTSTQLPLNASSSSLASSSKLPIGGQPLAHTTIMIVAPTEAELEEAEIYEDVLSPEVAELKLTDRAAEQLQRIATRENDQDVALRIAVESGGCHGYQYKMDLAPGRHPGDYLFTHPHIKPSNIVVDAVSLPLLKGSTLDFATELIGSTFRVASNPQAKGNGCGCGVSWELKD